MRKLVLSAVTLGAFWSVGFVCSPAHAGPAAARPALLRRDAVQTVQYYEPGWREREEWRRRREFEWRRRAEWRREHELREYRPYPPPPPLPYYGYGPRY